jgi:methylenetetrahydrofolate reductase (NADPH)
MTKGITMTDVSHSKISATGGMRRPPKVSFEFFPPKTSAGVDSFRRTASRLASLGPQFFSVTCGASGSTRESTFPTVREIARDTGVPTAAHMTCVGASRRETEELARRYWAAGITRIVAVRGDAPNGPAGFEKHPEGFANAAELVAGLKTVADFEISVAAYPEIHPESPSSLADLDNLKRKADAGATRAITQFFFDTDAFVRFVERARRHGISIPIVPGILPLTSFTHATRFARRCGASIPSWLTHLFESLDDQPETLQMVSASVAEEQCRMLQAAGVDEFHFYTLNRAELSYAVCHMLGLRAKPRSGRETQSCDRSAETTGLREFALS